MARRRAVILLAWIFYMFHPNLGPAFRSYPIEEMCEYRREILIRQWDSNEPWTGSYIGPCRWIEIDDIEHAGLI